MKKIFTRNGGKNVALEVILHELLMTGIVGWLEYNDEDSTLTKKSLKLVESPKYYINNGVTVYSKSGCVIFNTKESTLAIEAKSEKDTIPMYYRFKIAESEMDSLFEGLTFEFKKF